MNHATWVSGIVVFVWFPLCVCAGNPHDSSGSNSGNAGNEPDAADLVREVRASEDWLHRIDTLYLRTQSTWRHSPESIAAYCAGRRKEDPNWEPDPECNDRLWPSYEDELEYAIDFESKRLRYVANTPRRERLLRVWDANQFTQHVRRAADGYEQYFLGSTTDVFEWLFGGMSWPQARLHAFWWDARDTERLRDYFGYEEDFRLVGQLDYRGDLCHVLERTLRTDPAWVYRWYVGADDHLLRGRREYRTGQCQFEHWTLDYREVAPGCRMPMTQGYSVTLYNPDKGEYYVDLCRDVKIIEARVNESLSDELFRVEFVEGALVFDERSGESLVYKYVSIPPSLLGKPLPDVSSLGVDSAANPATAKGILLCFVNLGQRPSRHCVARIAADYERLGQQVAVVAADVSGTDETSLNQWCLEERIPFVVRGIGPDDRTIRQRWGIRSLPWLILADQDQIVRAERLSLEELSARVREVTDGEP